MRSGITAAFKKNRGTGRENAKSTANSWFGHRRCGNSTRWKGRSTEKSANGVKVDK